MSRKIQSSRGSSVSFAATLHPERRAAHAAWVLHPSASRLLAVWRGAVHGLAAVSIVLCGLAWPLKLVAVAALLAFAVIRRGPEPLPIERDAAGAWSLPSLGLEGLELRPGTAVGPFWARLALGSDSGVAVTVLVLVDQVDRESWRRLQVALRGAAPAGTV